ncbi:hypothetical protein [Streptomyces sp. NPDC002889]|uniref:hypothetical protein n=1 Tax=Streptomyces sp. NPDC002889 TaxID=3364669 RepID=UPI0036A245F2
MPELVDPGLAELTIKWKSAPADVRLTRRSDLLTLADLVKTAYSCASAVVPALDIPFATGRDLEVALDLTRDLGAVLADARARARIHSRAIDRALGNNCDRTLDRALDLAIANSRDLAEGLTRARVLGFGGFDNGIEFDPVSITDRARLLERGRGLANSLARELGTACTNLADAASDFTGVNITVADATDIDLAWLRWDDNTQWPNREWADRMRRASVEHPPGSGTYIVLPLTDRDPAESALV